MSQLSVVVKVLPFSSHPSRLCQIFFSIFSFIYSKLYDCKNLQVFKSYLSQIYKSLWIILSNSCDICFRSLASCIYFQLRGIIHLVSKLFFVCVCNHAHVGVGSECVHMCGHVDTGQRLHYFVRWDLSLNVEFADLVRQVASKAQEYFYIFLPSVSVISTPAGYT